MAIRANGRGMGTMRHRKALRDQVMVITGASSGIGLATAVFAGVALADLATYVTTSFQLALAFPDAESGLAGALLKFLGVFAVTQIPLAVGEGLLGVLLFRVLTVNARPELERLGVLRPAPLVTTGDAA